MSTTQFLVETGNFKFLFNEVRSLFEKNQKTDLFFECHEYFIMKNMIKYMPPGVFKDLCYFF